MAPSTEGGGFTWRSSTRRPPHRRDSAPGAGRRHPRRSGDPRTLVPRCHKALHTRDQQALSRGRRADGGGPMGMRHAGPTATTNATVWLLFHYAWFCVRRITAGQRLLWVRAFTPARGEAPQSMSLRGLVRSRVTLSTSRDAPRPVIRVTGDSKTCVSDRDLVLPDPVPLARNVELVLYLAIRRCKGFRELSRPSSACRLDSTRVVTSGRTGTGRWCGPA
jgi:hypothetical protein